ncbi:NitT/TauT family transport system substrate-binding protein [Pseudoclavibacter sp. JAI123]|uniref:ABC transporter substrate-binding protein n=1 Tax=Pseudoclavibacter sp. JAI123 TaxID=2723065 RepID=UPI0015CE6A25|nr:ABC transporter substrate-binding protein [Pseudoclavibacter sp. JAI123]NYF13895.1 NitT/TauT family transport system substrate-binding protein [Pseudoclavibacter sp. JAI123]
MRTETPTNGRRLMIATALIASGGLLAACSGGAPASTSTDAGAMEDLRLSLDWSTYVAYHAPFAVAEEQGIYEAHGLNVTETLPGGSGDALIEVGTNKTDIAWADLSTAAASMLQGVPVTSVAKVQASNASGLTVLEGTPLESADDVRGMRIGSTPGGSDSTLVGAFLSANGISEDEVQIVNLPANGKFAALMTGEVDAISGQVYFSVSNARAQGQEASGLSYSELGLEMLDHGFVSSDGYIESNPESITKFLDAYREALQITIDDPAAACETLVAKADGALLQDDCESQLDLWLPLVTPTDDAEWGRNVPGEWESTVSILKEHGDATGDRAPDSMFTNDYLPAS